MKLDDRFNFNDSWAEMEKLLDTGKVRAIGVSNFSVQKYVDPVASEPSLALLIATFQSGEAIQDCEDRACR